LDIFSCFVEDYLTIELRVHIWALYSVPLVYVSFFTHLSFLKMMHLSMSVLRAPPFFSMAIYYSAYYNLFNELPIAEHFIPDFQ